jgi:hypothetical protein
MSRRCSKARARESGWLDDGRRHHDHVRMSPIRRKILVA